MAGGARSERQGSGLRPPRSQEASDTKLTVVLPFSRPRRLLLGLPEALQWGAGCCFPPAVLGLLTRRHGAPAAAFPEWLPGWKEGERGPALDPNPAGNEASQALSVALRRAPSLPGHVAGCDGGFTRFGRQREARAHDGAPRTRPCRPCRSGTRVGAPIPALWPNPSDPTLQLHVEAGSCFSRTPDALKVGALRQRNQN